MNGHPAGRMCIICFHMEHSQIFISGTFQLSDICPRQIHFMYLPKEKLSAAQSESIT